MRRVQIVATLAIAACATPKQVHMVSPLAADAIAGVTDAHLRDAVAAHWEYLMHWAPTWATTLGDHRFDDRLAPRDQAAFARAATERDAIVAQLRAIDPAALGGTDRTTRALLLGQLEASQASDICKAEEWNIDAGGGSLFGEFSYLIESHQVKTARDAQNVVARLRQAPQLIDDTIANYRRGVASGRVAAEGKLTRALKQLDDELATPVDHWQLLKPAWAAQFPTEFAQLREVVAGPLKAAFERERALIRDELLPHARHGLEGLSGFPDGEQCYAAAILTHVGLAKTAQELHALGEAEIARTDRELAALGQTVLGAPDLAATIAKLRGDPALYFTTREEILAAAQHALDRANAAVPSYFSVLPKTPCVMREIPAYEAPYSTIAYYRQPHYDGSKPGEYYVNTSLPTTRPRFELEALTWHESVPGHHLQIAIAQELGALPAFRKLDGSTAYVEGWALYTERLADEIGLYSSDLDRLGKLSYDAWRASRLVVDTGLHAFGWTRAQAEAYMLAHTALTPVNIANEVDRYIGWPGQALGYKVGQLEIFRLRDEAKAALGDRFDLKEFHRVVLGSGAVTLPVLGDLVRAWIASR